MASNPTDSPIPRASPTKGTIRGRMEAAPDKSINFDMGKGDSWAKDVRNGNQGVMLDDIPKLVSVLGLKLVSRDRICITPAELAHYRACETIAAGALNPQPRLDQDFDA